MATKFGLLQVHILFSICAARRYEILAPLARGAADNDALNIDTTTRESFRDTFWLGSRIWIGHYGFDPGWPAAVDVGFDRRR